MLSDVEVELIEDLMERSRKYFKPGAWHLEFQSRFMTENLITSSKLNFVPKWVHWNFSNWKPNLRSSSVHEIQNCVFVFKSIPNGYSWIDDWSDSTELVLGYLKLRHYSLEDFELYNTNLALKNTWSLASWMSWLFDMLTLEMKKNKSCPF